MKTYSLLFITSCCLLVLLLSQPGSSAPRCTDYDLPAPAGCKYGTKLDWCRNGVCAKGPGQRCGGYRWEHGKCGEGTMCRCGVCVGCSPIDGGSTCFNDPPIC